MGVLRAYLLSSHAYHFRARFPTAAAQAEARVIRDPHGGCVVRFVITRHGVFGVAAGLDGVRRAVRSVLACAPPAVRGVQVRVRVRPGRCS